MTDPKAAAGDAMALARRADELLDAEVFDMKFRRAEVTALVSIALSLAGLADLAATEEEPK